MVERTIIFNKIGLSVVQKIFFEANGTAEFGL
jgi:hypothetical protein